MHTRKYSFQTTLMGERGYFSPLHVMRDWATVKIKTGEHFKDVNQSFGWNETFPLHVVFEKDSYLLYNYYALFSTISHKMQ